MRTTQLIRFLGKLECGFHDFCLKKSLQAKEEGKDKLADELLHHANQENVHAKMLWSLLDKQNRPQRTKIGFIATTSEYFADNSIQWTKNGNTKQWQHTDGISIKYATARAFFNQRKAADYDWADSLAFMCIGENLGKLFYYFLSTLANNSLQQILKKIAQDEDKHHQYLWNALVDEMGIVHAYLYLIKWYFQAIKAILYIPHDLREILKRETTRT
jgi:rubrerythrin